jgi:hypothetical protein
MQIYNFSVEKKSAVMVLAKAKDFGPIKSTDFSMVSTYQPKAFFVVY